MNEQVLQNTIQRCREREIIIPTYEQMKHPETIPAKIQQRLKDIDLWAMDSMNLFRINWKNNPTTGGFGKVNYLEFPRELTGTKARILALCGKFFPTGAHKVGATFGPLVSRMVRGEFDPTTQKAVWPSTGNYCRGGAYDSALLGCHAIAILPKEMSRERFEWLETVGAEIIATPGCESNVKEIYDKCWELKKTRGNEVVVLNQFEEFGNPIWHYEVTGSAIDEVLQDEMGSKDHFAGLALSTGSAGTLGCADYLRKLYPRMKVCAAEALQCPTLLNNGFGAHRIEGIGDKHIPWVHNVANTDMIAAIDDEDTMRIIRLFNEPAGQEALVRAGVNKDLVDRLDLVGVSGVGNLLAAIKMAHYYELDEQDVVFTILTDSMELYGSRLEELKSTHGEYTPTDAAIDLNHSMLGQKTDNLLELSYLDQKRIHNLKYFTWVEQQAREVEELNAQWYDRNYWENALGQASMWDQEIKAFNDKTELLKKYL
jgi:cysteine synthase